MLPELLRFSSASGLLAKIPEAQQAHHRRDGEEEAPVPAGGAAVGGAKKTQGQGRRSVGGWGEAAFERELATATATATATAAAAGRSTMRRSRHSGWPARK